MNKEYKVIEGTILRCIAVTKIGKDLEDIFQMLPYGVVALATLS